MLALATYLGHVNINTTYWYLKLRLSFCVTSPSSPRALCKECGHDSSRTAHGSLLP